MSTVALQVMLSGTWTDVPLYSAGGSAFQHGGDPYGTSWPYPSTLTAEINNDTLAWDPARPESPLYELAGRSTPARMIVNGTVVAYGEASSWVPDKTLRHVPGAKIGRSHVVFTAAGQLERLGAWTEVVRSPMWRTISARSTSIGHWPLEDPKLTRNLANSVSGGGGAGSFRGGAVFGETERPFGAASTVKLSADTQLAGTFKPASTTAGWQISFSLKAASLPGAGIYGRILRWTTSNGYTWVLEFTDASWRWTITASDGTVLLSSAVAYVQYPPTDWVTMRLKVSQVAGNVQVEPAWYQQGAATPVGITNAFAGTVGALRTWWHDGSTVAAGSWLSHVFAVSGVADDLQSATALQVFNGYSGERAFDRYTRIAGEAGISAAYYDGGVVVPSTAQMGPQPVDTVVNILKEITATDGGFITDYPTVPGLHFRARRNAYGRPADLTLDYAAGQVAPPFRRQTGVSGVANVVTAKNAGQGEYTATLASGPNSIAAPPAGISERRASIDVNLYDDQSLIDRTTWELARLSTAGPRYGEVSVDLLKWPALATLASGMRPGYHLLITGFPPDDVHLLITQVRHTAGAIERRVTFGVEPFDLYQVGKYSDTVWRWALRYMTVGAGATSTATSLTVTTTDRADVLSATAAPLDLMISGERVTVTAVSAPAGTGPYTQTLTVTRSVNGVVKAQVTGGAVQVVNARRWGY